MVSSSAARLVVCSPPMLNTQLLELPSPQAKRQPQLQDWPLVLPDLLQLPPVKARVCLPRGPQVVRPHYRPLPVAQMPKFVEVLQVLRGLRPQHRGTQGAESLKATPDGFKSLKRWQLQVGSLDPPKLQGSIAKKAVASKEGVPDLDLWKPLISSSTLPWIPRPPPAPYIYKELPELALRELGMIWPEGRTPKMPETVESLPERPTPQFFFLKPKDPKAPAPKAHQSLQLQSAFFTSSSSSSIPRPLAPRRWKWRATERLPDSDDTSKEFEVTGCYRSRELIFAKNNKCNNRPHILIWIG